jgi:predicted TIM-barrel fold metal-dependent hydrolase
MGYKKVISSDSHVVEPPYLWEQRMNRQKWGDAIPELRKGGEDDPTDWWYFDNLKFGPTGNISAAGKRFTNPKEIIQAGVFDNVRPGGFIPEEHVKDMDIDGVWGGVLYPSTGLPLYGMENNDLLRDVFSAYNDWLAEFCSAAPDRIKGIGEILLDEGVDQGIAEMRRAKEIGLAGVMISSYPRVGQSYDMPMYESFWAAAQEIDIPVTLHVTTNRPGHKLTVKDGKNAQSGADRVNHDYFVRMDLAQMIYAGVFERYPKLKVVEAEHEIAWLPYFINRMDMNYKERHENIPYRFKGDTLPSDFMRNNVLHSFQEDDLGIQMRDLIGVHTLMWGSDYPHAESTFPESQRILSEILQGVPQDEQDMIVGGNCAKLYGFY